MEITINNASETEKLAQQIAKKIEPNTLLALYGDLGTGKTTFTSFLVKALGFKSRVQSPTFVVVRNYVCDEHPSIKKIYHLDLYRLSSLEEILDLGIEDFLEEPDSLVVVEWPELMQELFPEKTIKMYFDYISENSRKINVQNLPR